MHKSVVFLTLFSAAILAFSGRAQSQNGGRSLPPSIVLPAGGTIHALVVGIDEYPNLSPHDQLSGAAEDAIDIATSLKRVGVKDLSVLLDTAATRAAFTEAMEALIRETRPGDLVIITFAGHGSKEKERVPGSEPDGMDEIFVLSLLAEEGPNTRERIIDDEIYDWLRRLSTKGVSIIFLADSCHGGGMTKATTRGGDRTGVRGITRVYNEREAGPGAYYIAPGNDQLSVPASIPASDNATFDIPSLTFLAGADSQSKVVERTIDGQRRGALSYAFARAIDGSKLSGDITRAVLFKSVHQHVLQLTEHQQSPVLEPRTAGSGQRFLFRKVGGSPDGAIPAPPIPQANIVTLEGTATAPAPKGLYAFWDRATGDVISETRSVLAYGVPESALRAVAERVTATASLARMAAEAPLQVSLSPTAGNYGPGQSFKLVVEGIYGRYLVLVNLAGNGEIEYLFPTGNANPLIIEERLEIPMHATPPFGTDTLIAVASVNRRPNMELDLSLLQGQSKPRELLRAIKDWLKPGDVLGVISYGTHP
jgi:Caspase domain